MSHNIDELWDIDYTAHTIAAGVNVRFAGELQSFIQDRVLKSGLYSSTSEYIRDLVRRDYEQEEQEEQRKWAALRHELKPGVEADAAEFVPLNAESSIKQAKARKKAHGR